MNRVTMMFTLYDESCRFCLKLVLTSNLRKYYDYENDVKKKLVLTS